MSTTNDESTVLDPEKVEPIPATVPQVLVDEVVAAEAGRQLRASRFGGFDKRAFVRHCVAFGVFALLLGVGPGLIGDPTRVRQFAEYLCYAMVAVGIDIAWGYGKMLTLGHGVFFGLGAYSMGMYLTLAQTPEGGIPAFMRLYSDYTSLPAVWAPFRSQAFAWGAAILIPVIVATLLGLLVFKRRIRGPYFALLTQASALAFWLFLIGQLPLFAGTNGLTNFKDTFGFRRSDPLLNDRLYFMAAAALFVVVLLGWQLVRSRYGRLLIATRDSEDRVRFLGYDPATVKTVAFATSAGMAGLAGALSAAVIGSVAPDSFSVLPSILMVCWVAVGGRGTLWGAVVGAIAVSWSKTAVSETWPTYWIYLQGLLFVVVLGFSPLGIAGLLSKLRGYIPIGRNAAAARNDAVVAEEALA